jgi:hypothetical protein
MATSIPIHSPITIGLQVYGGKMPPQLLGTTIPHQQSGKGSP